jgi:hypothetical protein
MDKHWDKASLHVLSAFVSPKDGSDQGIHRAGMSVKADLVLGFVADILYTYNAEAKTHIDGLSFSAGFDYSFFEGKLMVLAEYLYNGASSSTSINSGNLSGLSNENYLYTGFTFLFNDYTQATAALISGFNDVSFTPFISLEHELFQGCSLNLSAQIPLDRDLFSGDGNRGELGPLPPGSSLGSYFNFSGKIRLRF